MPLNGFLLFRLRTLLAIVTVIVDDAIQRPEYPSSRSVMVCKRKRAKIYWLPERKCM